MCMWGGGCTCVCGEGGCVCECGEGGCACECGEGGCACECVCLHAFMSTYMLVCSCVHAFIIHLAIYYCSFFSQEYIRCTLFKVFQI